MAGSIQQFLRNLTDACATTVALLRNSSRADRTYCSVQPTTKIRTCNKFTHLQRHNKMHAKKKTLGVVTKSHLAADHDSSSRMTPDYQGQSRCKNYRFTAVEQCPFTEDPGTNYGSSRNSHVYRIVTDSPGGFKQVRTSGMTSRTAQDRAESSRITRPTTDCHGRATEALQISPRIVTLCVRDGPGGSGSLETEVFLSWADVSMDGEGISIL